MPSPGRPVGTCAATGQRHTQGPAPQSHRPSGSAVVCAVVVYDSVCSVGPCEHVRMWTRHTCVLGLQSRCGLEAGVTVVAGTQAE